MVEDFSHLKNKLTKPADFAFYKAEKKLNIGFETEKKIYLDFFFDNIVFEKGVLKGFDDPFINLFKDDQLKFFKTFVEITKSFFVDVEAIWSSLKEDDKLSRPESTGILKIIRFFDIATVLNNDDYLTINDKKVLKDIYSKFNVFKNYISDYDNHPIVRYYEQIKSRWN